MLNLHKLPNANMYLRLATNTPYVVVPTKADGNLVGRWDGEVDDGSPVLRDLCFEHFSATWKRLGPLVRIGDVRRTATHLLCFHLSITARNQMHAVVLTEDGAVLDLNGNKLRFAYDSTGKFRYVEPWGEVRKNVRITAYEIKDFRTCKSLSKLHRTEGGQ